MAKKKKAEQEPQESVAAQAQPTAAQTRARKKQARKSRVSRIGLIVAVAIGCAAMLLSVSGIACSGIINGGQSESSSTGYKLTGGVAATVIDSYARQFLIEQAEKEYSIDVTDADVEKAWKDAAKTYGSEKAFVKILKQYGYTQDTYKSSLKENLAQQKLKDKVAPEKKPSDKKIIKYVNENLSTYNDARRSSQILIKVDSNASDKKKAKAKEKAQKILDEINSGKITFAKAAKKYSDDTASAKEKGDVGWDKLTTFVDEYQTALSGLSKGQMSGVVESTYGYHIIVCTDYFHVDGSVTDIKQVPNALKKYVINVIKTQDSGTKYSNWLESYIKKADIKINEMPSDVPYNVSLKGVKKSASDSSDSQ